MTKIELEDMRKVAQQTAGRAGELLQIAVTRIEHDAGAFRHIVAACDSSRTSTRRIRWIRERADSAANSREWCEDLLDLPKFNSGSAERERARRIKAEAERDELLRQLAHVRRPVEQMRKQFELAYAERCRNSCAGTGVVFDAMAAFERVGEVYLCADTQAAWCIWRIALGGGA